MNDDARAWEPTAPWPHLRARARIYAQLRQFFAERDVLEVQTANLAPDSVTEPSIESLEVTLPDGSVRFLQTSPEYQMKRLLAAGAGPIYQLGPVYRAGEAGRWHNPEFTLLEWYRPGFDDNALMREVAELVDQVLGTAPYVTRSYGSLVGQVTEAADRSREELDLALLDALKALDEPRVFIVDYPADQAALARLRPDDPALAARFELVVQGVELANGYYELGDAEQLRQRFVRDNAQRQLQGLPEMAIDELFLAAMAAGLPDCSGVALGVDRLVMLATGATSIADVIAFSAQGS